MKLPDSLAGWAPYLDIFPKEIGAALFPMVRRLAAGIGPLHSENTAGSGEPDGFNGLHRSGNYERLLLSEWLLAEEAPDEFLRRAAMGEHAFLRLARKEPSSARISLALFDAGPNQMGTPRIAQLAALLVLARRAEAAGADFRWAILQDQDEDYTRAIDASGVWRFLQSRTANEASAWAVGWWLRDLEPEEYKDVWIVGGSRLAQLPAAADLCRLEVTDPLEDVEERLDVAIRLPGRAPRHLSLPLPHPGECARLLRDPFGAVAREAVRLSASYHSPTSNMVFTSGGGRLIARSARVIVMHHMPNSARAGQGRPHTVSVPEGWTCVAAGRMRKTTLFALVNDSGDHLRLQRIAGRTERMQLRDFEVSLPLSWARLRTGEEDPPLGEIAEDPDSPSSMPNLLIRIGTTLVRARPYAPGYDETRKRAELIEEGVMALASERGNVRYLVHTTSGTFEVYGDSNSHKERELRGPFRPDPQMFLGWRPHYAAEPHRVSAVAGARREWRLQGSGGLDRTIIAPEGTEVVGVMGELQAGQEPGLVILDADRRRLSVIGPGWSQLLPPSLHEISHVTVSTGAPLIAYATETGVFAWRCDRREIVYRLIPAPEGEA